MEKAGRKRKAWLNKTANFAVGIFFVFLFFLMARPVEAGNQQITFQGKLTNASGNTVSNGTYYVKLTIYDAATGGSCQYTASSTCASVTSTPVTVTNGIFSINLGDTSASLAAMSSTLFNNSALYLGITVCSGAGAGCDSEMTPRKRITASPYAFNADYLSGLATSTIGGQGSYVPVTDSSGNFKISNSVFVASTTAGQFGVGTTTIPTGIKSYIESATASNKLLVIRGNSSQTGNLQEWQNNAGTPIAYVNSSGNISTSGTLNVSNGADPVGSVANPTHKGSIANGAGGAALSGSYYVFVSGNYAYIASSISSALEIVDISNPANPVHKGSISNGAGGAKLSQPVSVFVSGNYAYVTDYSGNALEIVDISNPANPVHKGSISNGSGGALLSAPDSVFVSGNYAYVTSISDALEIIDISNPANPVHKGSISNGTGGALLNDPAAVYVSGNYAYVAAGTSDALEIIDISNPAAPVHKGSISKSASVLLDAPASVFVSGNYAYLVSSLSSALEIINVSNPASPAHSGSLANGSGGALLSAPYSVFVSGNYAYIASGSSNALEIVDVASSTVPVHKSALTTGTGGALLTNPYSVFVSGNYAYVSSYDDNALEIVDISGATISNAQVGSLSAGSLQVNNFAQFNQNLLINSGLNVGGNTQLSGDVSIGGGRATSTIMSGGGINIFTNQASSTFLSRVLDVSNSTGFIFNSGTSTWTGADRNLVSFQTGGIDKFLFVADGSMIVNKASGFNLGKFYVDSSGSVSASGTLGIFGNVNFNGGVTLGDSVADSITVNGRLDTINISNGTTATTTISKNSLSLGIVSGANNGLFFVDSSGNVSASGSIEGISGELSNAFRIYNTAAASNAVRVNNDGVKILFDESNVGYEVGIGTSNPVEKLTVIGNIVSADGSTTSTFTKNSLILGQISTKNVGTFYIDSLGNTSASGTLGVFGNTTLGDSDAGAGDTTRVYGSFAMGAAPTGNAQLFLKASSTFAAPLLMQDDSSNVIGKFASSTVDAIVGGAQVTLRGYSALTLGDAGRRAGALSINAVNSNSPGAIVLYRDTAAVGAQLTPDALIVSGSSNTTSTFSSTDFTLKQTANYNQGIFYVDSSGNASASGTLRVFGGASTGGLKISASDTNTTITSFVSGTTVGAFILDTNSTLDSVSSTVLFSIRNRGAKVFSVDASGYVTATGTIQANNTSPGPGDVAEYVNLVAGESAEVGDVLVVDSNGLNQYRKSDTANARNVAGVISGTGAFLIGASGDNRAPLALAGLVKVKITDENGPVEVGDYLTTASKPGYAMRFDADAGISAGLVGMALEPWASGNGKITILVNKGLAMGNAAINGLNTSQNGSGQLVWGNDLNLHLSGRSILDVLSIKSQDEKWTIDEEGYLVIKVETQQGDKMLYGLQSGQDKEVVFSGSSQLENGVKKIELPAIDKEIIDTNAPIKVSVTLTGEANGVFVTEKSYEGFTVKELNNGSSNATFDWLVIAKRRVIEDSSTVEEPLAEVPETPVESASAEVDTATSSEEIINEQADNENPPADSVEGISTEESNFEEPAIISEEIPTESASL
ncbi:MAG: hypothetical protein HY569_00570 [Candidatus Magasanikbacteria bacterium]|nr:hypothetical protein [Candidatus Magasanikbacteria bacterium]